jgi:para-nitrobenzyl esterase
MGKNPEKHYLRLGGSRSLLQSAGKLITALLVFVIMAGCNDSSSSSSRTGVFNDSPVTGLGYETASLSGTTDSEGTFRYRSGQNVTFSVGDLVIGSAEGKAEISPVDIVEGASGTDNPVVVNISRFLQSLDEDGNLNNGIQITSQTAGIVSTHAETIDFTQSPDDFAQNQGVSNLLAELNQAGVFTDLDPRPRGLRSATHAREHLARSLSQRKTVTTASGDLRGFEPAADSETWQWLGIPYAKPPVGELRWRPPQSPEPWPGVREATEWGDQAAQRMEYEAYGEGGMSEDCLYLNVTAPKNADNLPVMVWFHGGAFSILTGNTKAYNNPESLPTKDVVLVSVNHRLGSFGYMAHPLLTEESEYGGSGNYGQMDLIAALKWVQENISAFGGNPDNVTIFGESGGGMKSITMMSSPLAAGLFHRVICQSGMSPAPTPDLATAEAIGSIVINELGATTIEEMRAASWTEIVSLSSTQYSGGVPFSPNIDNYCLTKTMTQSIEDGLPGDVPLLAGANTADMEMLIQGFLWHMPMRTQNCVSPQYSYVFSHVPQGWAAQGAGAYHGIELVYVFNYPGSFYSHYLLGLSGMEVDYTKSPAEVIASTGYGAADMALSDDMMTIWSQFAKTGDPSVNGLVDWPVYMVHNDMYVELKPELEVKTKLADAFPKTGVFSDSPVQGLSYATQTLSGTTDESGTFRYIEGQNITFAMGGLELGTARADKLLSPIDMVPGASGAADTAVVNISRLLQSLDQDGDLNNGIQISSEIAQIVSGYSDYLTFGQSPENFGSDSTISDLLDELNAAEVFTDLDPRPRTLRSADDARQHLVRSLSPAVVVSTSYGDIQGFEPESNTDTWQWLGIPYAKAPVGELRWRPPQPPEPWQGVRQATDWGDQAAQNPVYEAFGEGAMSEDCLYLNITAPKDADNFPVMVYFHGGGFRILTGNTKAFNNPDSLPAKDVILITVNHRLGPFGYFAHPELSDESGYGGSGNYGQMDLVAALEWIQENIGAFGGDAGNVTIFGESGGGGKVHHLLASPQAAGLFHKAIMQSGMYSTNTTSLATAEQRGLAVSSNLGVENQPDVLGAMREKTWLEILAAAEGLPNAEPNVDGWHLPDTVRNIFAAGQQNDVPVISGINREDLVYLIDTYIAEMPVLADNFASDVYAYIFDHVMTGWAAEGGIAYHGIELVYVFNYPASAYVHHALGLTGLPEGSPPPLGWGTEDMQVVDYMMSMWANFARTGDPGIPAIDWIPYTSAQQYYLEIGQGGILEMQPDLSGAYE